jgi:AraC-like DNA-binding protein
MLATFSGQMAKEKYAQAEEGLQRFMDACFVTSAPLPEDMKPLLQVVAGTVLTAYYTAAKRPDPTQLEQLTKAVSDPFRCGTLERLRELLVAPIHSLRQEEFAPAEGDWLQTVRFYIAGHLDRPELTLTEIAGQVHLSPAYVSRTFKQQCGLGLTDYIQELRVEKAEQLLGTGKSLSEIASDCGFSSLRTMRNVFMKHKGKTPSACRRD